MNATALQQTLQLARRRCQIQKTIGSAVTSIDAIDLGITQAVNCSVASLTLTMRLFASDRALHPEMGFAAIAMFEQQRDSFARLQHTLNSAMQSAYDIAENGKAGMADPSLAIEFQKAIVVAEAFLDRCSALRASVDDLVASIKVEIALTRLRLDAKLGERSLNDRCDELLVLCQLAQKAKQTE